MFTGIVEDIGKITALWMLDSLREAEIAADQEDNDIRAKRGEPALPGGPDRAVGFQLRKGYREVRLEGGEYGRMKTRNPGDSSAWQKPFLFAWY